MTLGFTKLGHGFEPVWANDINEYAVRTYNANFGDHCVLGDIEVLLNDPDLVAFHQGRSNGLCVQVLRHLLHPLS